MSKKNEVLRLNVVETEFGKVGADNDADICGLLDDPDFVIKAMEKLKAANKKAAALNAKVKEQEENIAAIKKDKRAITRESNRKDKVIKELQPKADFCDMVLSCKDGLPVTVIAKEYGWSAQRLNDFLFFKKVQYKCGDVWVLYQKYAAEGYIATRTNHIKAGESKTYALWTQKGRKFIYELLKADGYLPLKATQEKVTKAA